MAAIAEDHPNLVFVPLAEAEIAPDGIIQCFRDCYWLVHPTKGLVHWKRESVTPQCNKNRTIAEQIGRQLYPWAEIRQIPFVFRRINPRDYAH